MSYQPDTILKRKTPLADESEAAAYDEVRVIGHSPLQRGSRSAEFSGQLGDQISVEPRSGFATVVDLPQGMLQRDYEVVSEPPRQQIQRQVIERVMPGPSPEEQFASINPPVSDVPMPRGRTKAKAKA